ncbi:hypothetical protein M426DRAFT_222750 [Hypoxylon sp. CI-4A]|nr:hypothetical protein M426DRAFT_222750 [Hypoxylon sp. CI-4A]
MHSNPAHLLQYLVRTIAQMETQMAQMSLRLENVEHDVKRRVCIPCPVEHCGKKFNSNAHRNRHIRDWIKNKSEEDHLWTEHDKAAEKLKLKDDNIVDVKTGDDMQQRLMVVADGPPQPTNLTLRSGPSAQPQSGRGFPGTILEHMDLDIQTQLHEGNQQPFFSRQNLGLTSTLDLDKFDAEHWDGFNLQDSTDIGVADGGEGLEDFGWGNDETAQKILSDLLAEQHSAGHC